MFGYSTSALLYCLNPSNQLHHLFREEGHEVDVRVTWENADAERYVKEALALTTVSTIVAAGGDGTVNEVLAAGRSVAN